MVTRMDRDIGRLMALLKELDLDKDTVVFFSSDNGAVFPLCGTDPEFFRSTWGLRGYKQDLYEGGIRAPFIARWPGHIKAGTVSEHAGAFWDMLPTFCELTGTPTPAGGDGISIAPTLLGRGEQQRHDFLYWEYHSGGSSQAVRLMGDAASGDWKAVRLGVKQNPNAAIELYRLKTDPAESKDVAAEHPDVVARIKEIMAREHTPSAVPAWNF
jgi:arylsulfatase A-like enzyme